MKCTSPRTVGFQSDGKTLAWSPKKISKEFPTFPLPCSKCIACRLEYAREWAVRCMHEAHMVPNSIFLTLTYDDQNLPLDGKLHYEEFQNFMHSLRTAVRRQKYSDTEWKTLPKEQKNDFLSLKRIRYFVTGEYGDRTKRPHWHALLFNLDTPDAKYKYTSRLGDKVRSSEELQSLWGKGAIEFGSVTLKSAGYCARYAAKKLGHGKDGEHEYDPISKKSVGQAIGRSWIEKYWKNCFELGYCNTQDGLKVPIPRYYEKWLKKNQPEHWERYVTKFKILGAAERLIKMHQADELERKINEHRQNLYGLDYVPQITKNETREIILEQNLKRLREKQTL